MPLITAAASTTRRHVAVVGTGTNRPGWADISAGVRDEIAAARTLFLDLLGYERSTYEEIVDGGAELLKKVAGWRRRIAPTSDDWLVVYYTGHGVERAGSLHLITSDIEEDELETSPTAHALAGALLGGDKLPPHALLILDTCQSGAAHLDTASAAARLRTSIGGSARGADFHVVTTARSMELAKVGKFVRTTAAVLRSPQRSDPTAEHVDLQYLIEEVNRAFTADDSRQRATYSGAGETALRFVPNPTWQPHLRLAMNVETRARVLHRIQTQAQRSHWDPRARGVSTADVSGWYFTGRANAMRFVNDWLAQPSDGTGLVVKGLPGSGKSALLSRIATLADPAVRANAIDAGALHDIPEHEIPPVGAIDVAVHGRAKDPAQLALEIAAALGVDLSNAGSNPEAAAVAKITALDARLTIMVDALDEAARPGDCAVFLRALVQKGKRSRLIVGVREAGAETSGLTSLLGPRFTPLDLDAPQWREPDDLRRYVERYLRIAPDTPYADRAAANVAHLLAGAVAQRAGTSFLVASLTAHALVSRPAITDPAEFTPLPSTVREALALDLERFEGIAGEQLRQVLTALACGESRGLPADVWLAVAQALSNGDVTAADLDRWIKDAGFYIVRDEEFGVPVRRLYHEEFAAQLRADVDVEREAAIADGLLRTVGAPTPAADPAWDDASSYVLAFYAKHLRRAGRISELSDLASSHGWAEAKRRRFGDIGWVLSDLDLTIEAARAEQPPALPRIVRGCATYARFVGASPPIVIDTIAGLMQPTRAQAMADSVDFPLDRCHAFALLAPRWAALSNSQRAIGCVRAAERAARGVRAHFETMAKYWVVRAARLAGDREVVERTLEAVRGQLDAIAVVLRPSGDADHGAASTSPRDEKPGAQLSSWASARALSPEEHGFALPHWLFWAAMCFRDAEDNEGLQVIRDDVMRLEHEDSGWLGINLVLQTAAVTGAVKHLQRAASIAGGIKPGNLALALIDAGLHDDFDRLRAAGVFAEPVYTDSAKRYAWALARRGDYDAAFDMAARINGDHEEQARALYRIGCEASAARNPAGLDRLASAARTLRSVPHDGESWRVDSWLAAVMLAAGRTAEAEELAESVIAAGVIPGESRCLALATPQTAISKQHVRLESDATPDASVTEEVLQRARSGNTANAREYLETQAVSAGTRAQLLLDLAKIENDRPGAFDLWLDAMIVSRRSGAAMLRKVIDEGDTILSNAMIGETSRSLNRIVSSTYGAVVV